MRYFLTIVVSLFATIVQGQDSFKLEKRSAIDSLTYDSLKSTNRNLANVRFYNFSYTSNGSLTTGYLLTPAREGKFPCIVYNTGGNVGYRHFSLGMAANQLSFLAESGMVVIVSNYCDQTNPKNVDEFGGKDADNIYDLIRNLSVFSEIDTSRIGMYGWSRGGMESYMLLKRLPNIKAMVVGGALTDMEDVILKRPEMDSVIAGRIPGFKSNRKAEFEKHSAIKWVDKLPSTTPILLLHGNADNRVDVRQAIAMAEALSIHRIPYRLIIFEGGDHSITEHTSDVKMQTATWFRRFLLKDEKLPNMQPHGK